MAHRLTKITISLSPTNRRLIIFVPPLIIGTIYLGRKIYLYWRSRDSTNNDGQFYDADDYSPLSSTSANSLSLLNHSSLDKDNLDGCVVSSDGKKTRSMLINSKCSHCRSNQRLSFRETNVYETSLKNLSTGQLLKIGHENLQNVSKALEELRIKQSVLRDFKLESSLDEKVDFLFDNLSKLLSEFELLRNEYMPATYSNLSIGIENYDDEDFDDQASYLSSATTASLGYWDPEPNLHFFELYQEALKELSSIKPPKADRTIGTGSENYDDFLAKTHCLRQAFAQLFTNGEVRARYTKIGEDILRIIVGHSMRDANECINAYYAFLDYVTNEENLNTIEIETNARNIAVVSFYDIVLDYMILESFDDLENPPSAVKSIISNQWLSASFREIALQTTVSTVMRRKRSKLIVKDGFFEHFYSILDHLSPVLAWGFLGTDENLKFKCESIKESTQSVIRDYFSFDRCRYTYISDLCEDIKRVTEERYWELNNKLRILHS